MSDAAKWVAVYLINSVWQIPVLALCTAGLVKATPRGGAKLHYRLWVGCLVLAILLPAMPRVGREVRVGERAGVVRVEMSGGVVREVGVREQVAVYVREALEFLEERRAVDWLLGIYGVSILGGMVQFGRRLRVTGAVVRGATRMELPDLVARSMRRSAEALGVGAVEVWSSARVLCPATVSWPRAMLLVPEDFNLVAEEDAAAAIGHELAHVRRRDFETNLGLEVVGLVAFYHPALHWIARRVAEAREVLCDEMAAEATLGRTAYAKSLLSLAESVCLAPAVPGLLLGVLEGTTLERRIMKLIDARLPLSRRYRVASVVGCWVLLGAVAVGVGALSVRPSVAHAAGAAPAVNTPELNALAGWKANGPAVGDRPVKPVLVADAVAPPPPPPPGDVPRASTDFQYMMPGVKSIGGDVSAPMVLYQVDPEFSEEARAAKMMGTVTVGLIVDEDGRPEDVHVVRGVGYGLDQKAVEAVSQYKFKPAMENGQPVMVGLNIEVNFQIF
jgi:TonB family protein